MEATETKCKNCGGNLVFDPLSQNLKCSHCESEVTFESFPSKIEKELLTPSSKIEKSKEKYTSFLCLSCGRRSFTYLDTPSLTCASCGSADLKKTSCVEYVLDGIIPFSIEKKIASQKLMGFLRKSKFTPNNLIKLAEPQSLTGVYVPAFSYDFSTSTHYYGVGVNYENKNNHRIEKKVHFDRSFSEDFKDYVQSSSSFTSSLTLQNLGTFNEKDIKVFSPQFLYGNFAESVSEDLQTNVRNMKHNITQSLYNRARNYTNYDRLESFSCNTTFSDIYYKFLYLPVYKGVFSYKDKKYPYYVNGKTGKVTGKTPKSFWKIFFTALGVAGIFALIIFLITKFT